MSWKFIFYDWGGMNSTLFLAVNHTTPEAFALVVSFASLIGNYWTAPVFAMLMLWWSYASRSSSPKRACAIRSRLLHFGIAFAVAFMVALMLKFVTDFPRPEAVLGSSVHLIGPPEWRYSLPSGHSTYAALVAATLWPLVAKRTRFFLALYILLVGWSRIAAGVHFPADVLAGWMLGIASIMTIDLTLRIVSARTSQP